MSLIETYESKYGSLNRGDIRSAIKEAIKLENEETVCKADNCIGCKVVFDDCADAIKHTRNLMKKRLSGSIGHLELMRLNEERFGPAKPKLIKHWKQILGAYENEFMKVVNQPSILDKMPVGDQEFHRNLEKQLIYHGWVQPHIKNARLEFKTFHPHGKPVNEVKNDEPQLDDDFIPEIEQGELLL